MTTATKALLALAIILAVVLGVGWYLLFALPDTTFAPSEDLTGQAIFASGEYGFTIRYPETFQTDETFTSFYHLPATWRANALPSGTGTPVIALIGYRTASEHSYPRYFDAEIRIGVSRDPAEIARCETPAAEQGERQLPDRMLGGTPFKVFSFQSAGMMQYVKGMSYRVIHEGACYAVEHIAAGASYEDDPDSPDDIPQETLDAAYAALDTVVGTFAFSR